VTKYVFQGLLSNPKKMDYASISKKGYECFETYFVNVNHGSNCLLSTSRRYLAVSDYNNLVGLDSLWEIAGVGLDAEVTSAAKKFLTTCHIRLDFKV
jgi:hypothetical protein